MRAASAPTRGGEAVADLNALDGLHPHHGRGQLAVQAVFAAGERAQADGQAMRNDLDDAAEGVAVRLGRLDLCDHRRLRVGVVGAPRTCVDAFEVAGRRRRTVVGLRRSDRDDVRNDLDAQRLTEELTRQRSRSDPCRRLPGAGAFQHRPGVLEAVLDHARVVGVPGARPGQRRIACALEFGGVDGVGGHHGFPLGPFGVADLDGDRTAEGETVPDAGHDRDLVLLELHPGAPAVAEPSAGQLIPDVARCDVHTGDHALDEGNQGSAM